MDRLCRPYFEKSGQTANYQFYRTSRKVTQFYKWKIFWEVRYPQLLSLFLKIDFSSI